MDPSAFKGELFDTGARGNRLDQALRSSSYRLSPSSLLPSRHLAQPLRGWARSGE